MGILIDKRLSRREKDLTRTILGLATVSTKNRMTIPKKVCTKYGFNQGDTILFIEQEGKLVLKKGLLTRIG